MLKNISEFIKKTINKKDGMVPKNIDEALAKERYPDIYELAQILDIDQELLESVLHLNKTNIPYEFILKQYANFYAHELFTFKRFIDIIENSLKNTFPNIDNFNTFLNSAIVNINNKEFDKLYKLFFENRDFFEYKKYYDDIYKPIFYVTNIKFSNINDDTIYTVGLLHDVLAYEKSTQFNPYRIDKQTFEKFQDEFNRAKVKLGDEKQFDKYQLIEITNTREMFESKGFPRIFDYQANMTFRVSELINVDLFNYLVNMTKKYRMTISFLPNFSSIENFINEFDFAFESVQYGKAFTVDDLKLAKETNIKLIDDVLDDTLWVQTQFSNTNDIYFEELVHDFKTVDEDIAIATKMIHIQFKNDSGKINIVHFDYEIIYYTFENYDLRLTNRNQDGEYNKRMKIFKIDNTSIDFQDFYDDLYRISYLCFDNKNLIKEYFNKISNPDSHIFA